MSSRKLTPLTEDQIQQAVAAAAIEAADFIDSQISPLRMVADKYYQGETSLKAEKGRSQIVITKVRDAVKAVIPSVARVFTQNDVIAEFSSDDEGDDKICKDATVFVNNVYHKYGGYNALISGATDALKARVGVVKVSLEKVRIPYAKKLSQITEEQLEAMEPTENSNSKLEVTEKSKLYFLEDGTRVYDVIATRYITRNIWHLDPLPPECLLVNSTATCIDDARIIGTRQNMRVYDAVAMGLPLEELLDSKSMVMSDDSQMNSEFISRANYVPNLYEASDSNPEDPTGQYIYIGEFWMRLDADGDGLAELRHIITAGWDYNVIVDEPVSFCPLALFRSELQPHVFFPISLAEDMIQDQEAATSLTRGILDNTALVNSPRTEVNEARVNLEDVKNNEIGAIVRVKEMGQIQELVTPFVAGQTLPVLSYLNEVSEARSGVTRLSQGLDANALQSTSRIAANAAVTGADSRIEMMARNLGETGISSMFLAILRTAMVELKGAQSVQNAGAYSEVQPDTWHDQMSIQINVGLGNGRIDEKVGVLGNIAGVQQALMDKLGFQNPICGWENLRHTYKLLLRLGGLKTVSDFFPPVTTEILQQLDQQMQQAQQAAAQSQAPPVPDVKGAAQIKAQADMQINQAKLQQEYALKSKATDQQGQIDVAKLKVQQQGDLQRLTVQARTDMQRALMEDDRLRDKQEQDYAVAAQKVAMDDATKRAVALEVNRTRTVATEKMN